MIPIIIYALKASRKLYSKVLNLKEMRPFSENDAYKVSKIIYNVLVSEKPCMIARFGSTELTCVVNYLSIKNNRKNYLGYIKGKIQPWWWNPSIITQMHTHSGFFPPTINKIEQFCQLMIKDIPEVDVLGSWLPIEMCFEQSLKQARKVNLELLNPYFSAFSWTKALEGKKVLVVHPFASTIQAQYKKRELLFENNLLPKFELTTIPAIQSIAGEKTKFKDWFEALDFMKDEIDKVDYDICLIGAGAYGFPLAAHVKRMGKKAVHLGGSLQLLFGIKGKRWEDPNYNAIYNYAKLMNEYWVYPDDVYKPKNADVVEGACYW